MVKRCPGTVIRKKTYMGDRKLVKAIMDPDCEIIEDWAFANCSCLKEVWLPLTIHEVSEKAFLNCDALEQVFLYDPEDFRCAAMIENADPEDSAYTVTEEVVNLKDSTSATTAEDRLMQGGTDPVLLATTIKCYPKETNTFILCAKDETVFLYDADARLESFLMEDDSLGFVPFLAGGEEDYLVEDAAAVFRRKRQFLKVQLLYERMLAEKRGHAIVPELKAACLEWLRSHNPSASFAFLLTDTIHRDAYLDLYFTLELNKDVNIDELTALAEDLPEFRAKLLRKHLENSTPKNTLFSNLEI